MGGSWQGNKQHGADVATAGGDSVSMRLSHTARGPIACGVPCWVKTTRTWCLHQEVLENLEKVIGGSEDLD